jgi:hypothetical protein
MAGTIFRKALANLALKKLLFEDKVFLFTQSTLEQKKNKQYSSWAPPPLLAGLLQASPPRNKGMLLGAPFRR